jgi:hypothetical protein
MSENLFDTCVNWSCVTRCGYRTTSSTLFTVKGQGVWPSFLNIYSVTDMTRHKLNKEENIAREKAERGDG